MLFARLVNTFSHFPCNCGQSINVKEERNTKEKKGMSIKNSANRSAEQVKKPQQNNWRKTKKQSKEERIRNWEGGGGMCVFQNK